MFAIIEIGESMQIKKITKLKSGKYKILFDNKESILTYDDVVLRENLLYQKEVDLEKLKLLVHETSYYDVYHKMVRLISIKYRSLQEIKTFLTKESITNQEKQNIIDTLVQNGLIDDKRFTDCYINDRLYLSNDGPFVIYRNLLSYGILEDEIQSALEQIDPSVFYDKLYKQVEKKVKNNTKYSKYILKNKILQSFKEKGFEEKMIIDVFDACFIEENHVILKEYQKVYKKLSLKYEGEELYFRIKQKLYSKGFLKEEIENILLENK